MKYPIMISACVVIIILGSAGIGLLLAGRGFGISNYFHVLYYGSTVKSAPIPLFLSGTRQFKTGLQRAYIFLCLGIGVFGLAQIQLPLVSLFNWSFWINSGGLAVPYLLGVICIFYGIRALPNFFISKLDTVRIMTSRQQPNHALSLADRQALAGVYYKLEDYLMHDDPLKTFTQDELRGSIMRRFKLSASSWALLWQKK